MGLAYMVTAVECGRTEPVEWRIISGTCGAGSSILLRHSAQQDMKIMSVSYFQLGTFHSVRLNIKQSQYTTNHPKVPAHPQGASLVQTIRLRSPGTTTLSTIRAAP